MTPPSLFCRVASTRLCAVRATPLTVPDLAGEAMFTVPLRPSACLPPHSAVAVLGQPGADAPGALPAPVAGQRLPGAPPGAPGPLPPLLPPPPVTPLPNPVPSTTRPSPEEDVLVIPVG